MKSPGGPATNTIMVDDNTRIPYTDPLARARRDGNSAGVKATELRDV